MLLIKIIRFVLGYVRVGLWGKYPERFLNVCASKGIKVWNTRRQGEKIEFCVFAKDYKQLRVLRQRCPVNIRAKRKYGLPFVTAKYKRRSGLVVGFAMFLTALMIMPKFVWGVNISGNERITDERLNKALQNIGIYTGARIADIDAANMRLRLALLLPEVSWAAVNVDGAFVNVEIRESDEQPIADNEPCNLVADCDGRITAIYVKQGSATVKVGDGVRKGDMLVSGTEQYSSGITKFRHSDGQIIAETERTLTVTIPLNQIKNNYTGKVQKRIVLTIFDFDLPLYIGSVNYDYKLKTDERPVSLGGVKLPFTITQGRFHERVQSKYKLKENDARTQGLKSLKELEKKEFQNFEILQKQIDSAIKSDQLILTATYLLRGDIAKKEYIYISG